MTPCPFGQTGLGVPAGRMVALGDDLIRPGAPERVASRKLG